MSKIRPAVFSIVLSMLLFHSLTGHAQQMEREWSEGEKSVTIDSINNILRRNYIFPKVADKMTQSLDANLKKGKYNALNNPSEFARHLTIELQSICNDKHLSVNYNPSLIAAEQKAVTDEERAKRENERTKEMSRENFGFQEIKILDGNIGYLDLRAFMDPGYAGETAVAAMNFLSNTDALIVDLRHNGGGSPAMIQLITSYFFSSEPVHLNNFYYRPTNRNTQTWTLPHVPGVRRPDIELYVLMSSHTFSAAEEFSYNLKNLKRATLVGEKTGGGAHPTRSIIATDKFFVRVPSGRAINPITNTNWEGIGVKPDIEVSSSQALITAQIKALETLCAASQDSFRIQSYNWTLDGIKARNYPVVIDASILKSFAGKYGSENITYEKGGLRYHSGDSGEFALIPIAEDRFIVDGLNYCRLKFLKEKNRVVALVRLYGDGGTEQVRRN